MRDTSWKVRRAAGLALRSVGSPGLLVLKKMLSDHNSFAADMKVYQLDGGLNTIYSAASYSGTWVCSLSFWHSLLRSYKGKTVERIWSKNGSVF